MLRPAFESLFSIPPLPRFDGRPVLRARRGTPASIAVAFIRAAGRIRVVTGDGTEEALGVVQTRGGSNSEKTHARTHLNLRAGLASSPR